MDDAHQHRSHFFTVRLWLEPMGAQQREVRGKVRHVLSGETRYFRHLSGLTEWLAVYCRQIEQEEDQ